MEIIGTIKEIWRYPVKSMRGEPLEQCAVGSKGLKGDRGWAVRDDGVKEIRGGRNLPKLLNCAARYATEPREEPWPAATIILPDGKEVSSTAADVNAQLSHWIGRPVSIWPIVPPEDTEHYRRIPSDEEELRELFGREPGEPIPDLRQFPEILMKYVSVPGTYFDVTPVHILTTSTLAFLKAKNPGSDWSVRRFRPNIVIDTGDAPDLVENNWVGQGLGFGEAELSCEAPAPRCAITVHSQGDEVTKDPKILRTIVKEANQNVGIYCDVRKAGTIRTGDKVRLVA